MRGILAGDAWRHSARDDGGLHQESVKATSTGKGSILEGTVAWDDLFARWNQCLLLIF